MPDAPPCMAVLPPLQRREVAFLSAFVGQGGLRRVWPGQPSATSPWRPSRDGLRLELDVDRARADPENVTAWLRFISRSFLAPSTATALHAALNAGLRGGHRLSGAVLVDGVRLISVEHTRITEQILVPDVPGGVVLQLGARRSAQSTER